jgi:PBP1b-binding outer membrane lipoprotein LpoB
MKKLIKILLIVISIVLLGGCGAKKLSDNYSEDKLKAAAEAVINSLNNEKYDEIEAMISEDLKKQLTADKIKEVWNSLKSRGKYESISKIIFQEKKDYVVVVTVAKYEKGNIQFTLSFNKDMKLVGIYLK